MREALFRLLAASLLLSPTASLAAEEGIENPYCGKPDYKMMSVPPLPKVAWREMELLNEEEKGDPEIWRKLAFRPGAYGHSELGIRTMARLLGYPGRLGGKEEIENWIVERPDQEVANGLWNLWSKWVVKAKKRLLVPQGAMSNTPNDGDSLRFFASVRDRANFMRCVGQDMVRLYCEASLRERILPGDKVYFSGAGLGQEKGDYCKISLIARNIVNMAPAIHFIEEKKEGGFFTKIEKKTWIRKHPNGSGNEEQKEAK